MILHRFFVIIKKKGEENKMNQPKILSTLLITLAAISTLCAQPQRYEVKSGAIAYTITQSGNMMGVIVNGKGKAKTLFKAWGNIELHTEESSTTTMGRTEQERQMTKIDHGKLFVVDFDERVIYEYTPEMLKNSEYEEFAKTAKEMIDATGGKKIGEEKVMGYPCEVWEMMSVKLWLYKGIMLKSEAEIMGIRHTTTATKIDLDIAVSDDDLKLPDFPLKSASEAMMEKEGEGLTPEQMQQMQEMMKNFSASLVLLWKHCILSLSCQALWRGIYSSLVRDYAPYAKHYPYFTNHKFLISNF